MATVALVVAGPDAAAGPDGFQFWENFRLQLQQALGGQVIVSPCFVHTTVSCPPPEDGLAIHSPHNVTLAGRYATAAMTLLQQETPWRAALFVNERVRLRPEICKDLPISAAAWLQGLGAHTGLAAPHDRGLNSAHYDFRMRPYDNGLAESLGPWLDKAWPGVSLPTCTFPNGVPWYENSIFAISGELLQAFDWHRVANVTATSLEADHFMERSWHLLFSSLSRNKVTATSPTALSAPAEDTHDRLRPSSTSDTREAVSAAQTT
jgi:hypothetical protein